MQGDPKLGEVGPDPCRRRLRVVQRCDKGTKNIKVYLGRRIRDGPALIRYNGYFEHGDWSGDRPRE